MIYLNILIIGSENISSYWPRCAHLLERGLAESEGECDVSHLFQLLQIHQGYLLLGIDAQDVVQMAMALQFLRYPNYTVACIHSIGGRWVLANRHHWDGIKNWMKEQGATKVQGTCRPAQARLWQRLGLKPVYQIMRQDL